MLYLVIFSLYASLSLYILLAGADFGAGILELFTPKRHRQYVANITTKALGPVWEANHVWLILVIVILFTGFPKLHSLVVTHLHLPILLLLLGIILRGTAFVFRHYDAVKDGLQKHYRNVFIYSSAITPLFLGIIAGAGLKGEFPTAATDFHTAFIAPWFNVFSFGVGLFTVAICAYLAAAYLIGEVSKAEDQQRYIRLAKIFLGAVILLGGLVFGMAAFEELAFWDAFRGSVPSWGLVGLATLSLPLLWLAFARKRYAWVRVLAAGQVLLILVAVYWAVFPNFVLGDTNSAVDLYASAAPSASIEVLGWALVVGLSIIGPSVAYLLWVFKGNIDTEA